MDARTALAGVAGYSHRARKDQPAQGHLLSVQTDPPAEYPLGLSVLVSGIGPSLPVVPWIALLDDDVTTTTTDGMYLVYLFTSTLDAVYLSINQGATQHLRAAEADGHKGRGAEIAATREIALETAQLRQLIDNSLLAHTLARSARCEALFPRLRPPASRLSDTPCQTSRTTSRYQRICRSSPAYIPNAYSSRRLVANRRIRKLHDRCSSRCSLP